MNERGRHTLNEILSQPAAWDQALDVVQSQREAIDRLRKGHPCLRALFTGCGSTYYLSLAIASLFQELTGGGARAVPAGELLLYPDTIYESDAPTLLVAISRSGTTTETVAAVRRFKHSGRGPAVVITTDGDSPLAGLADLALAIPAGREESVAQTRSFASMYQAGSALAALCGGRDDLLAPMRGLSAIGTRLIEQYHGLARSVGQNLAIDRYYFLGSGSRYGLACEVNLKMKEMSLTHSEPFHFFEFRHGPMAMVDQAAAVVGLRSSTRSSHEQAVLTEMRVLGAYTLSLGEDDADVAFESGLPEEIRNVLYLPVLQLMAYYRALVKGLDPDNPRNLNAVVYLDTASL
jgi:glucosamine--fructose-6-phosphate aminotransferase (isomerizing)